METIKKEEKEIGKLLELLNEYEKNNVVNWYERSDDEGVLTCRYIKENFLYYWEEASTIAISKYYGFIQWLVDNDKIDRDIIGWKPENIHGDKNFSIYERLLMILSISDTPIEDLISYLK